jgi:hypothetical protein
MGMPMLPSGSAPCKGRAGRAWQRVGLNEGVKAEGAAEYCLNTPLYQSNQRRAAALVDSVFAL